MRGVKASSSDPRSVRTLFCHWTWQVANARKFLELAYENLKNTTATQAFAFEQFRQAVRNGDEEKKRYWEKERKEAKEEFEKAKAEFDEAKREAEKAKEELEKAQSSTAPFQAGGLCRFCMYSCCCSCGPPFLLFGGALRGSWLV